MGCGDRLNGLLLGPLLAACAGAAAGDAIGRAGGERERQTTDAPIIGVLTMPAGADGCWTLARAAAPSRARDEALSHVGEGASCFHSIYARWIESAGGRVVPLLYNSPPEELDALFGSLNGVLFTGGAENVSRLDSPYMRAAARLLEGGVKAHAAGEHVPVWGTCLGVQTLSVLAARDPSVLRVDAFDSEGLMLPLELEPGAASTGDGAARLLRSLPSEVLEWLQTENVTSNLHHDGVPPDAGRRNAAFNAFFRVVSTNVDRRGRRFISAVEGRQAPVFGVQFHPERPMLQFSQSAGEPGIGHSPHAIRAGQAFANFFVDEARRNGRRFVSAEEEARRLIYNYQAFGPLGDSYQAYLFPPPAPVSGPRAIIV